MNIKRKKVKNLQVRELKIGQTFVEDGEVYMRVRIEEETYCPNCDEEIDLGNVWTCLAVELRTGDVYSFEPYAYVETIECEVVEI